MEIPINVRSFFHSIENLHAPIKNQYEKIS